MSGEPKPAKESGDMIVPMLLAGLAAVLFVMAAVFLGMGMHFTGKVEAMQSWPTTEAVVVTNEINQVPHRDPKSGQWYEMGVRTFEFTYEVEGRSYTGQSYNLPGAEEQLEADAHPVGSALLVRYDPTNPATAGVGIKASPVNTYLKIAGGGLAALGLVFAAFGVRSWLRIRRAAASG